MNLDAAITEKLIKHYTSQDIPILTIHDSYIIWDGHEEDLDEQMHKAFAEVTGMEKVKLKDEAFHPELWEPLDYEAATQMNYGVWQQHMEARFNPPRSRRYQFQWDQFKALHQIEKPISPDEEDEYLPEWS